MAKLTTKARKNLPAGAFAGPDRSFPIPDKKHAADAKARASEGVHQGSITKSVEARIDAKADAMLKKGKKS